MNEKTIALVNNVIILVSNDVEKLVPIKPICEALEIDYPTQFQKLKDDDFLGSVIGLSPTTGADEKTYEMVCLPLRYVFGWLFTINPKNVNARSQRSRSKVSNGVLQHALQPFLRKFEQTNRDKCTRNRSTRRDKSIY